MKIQFAFLAAITVIISACTKEKEFVPNSSEAAEVNAVLPSIQTDTVFLNLLADHLKFHENIKQPDSIISVWSDNRLSEPEAKSYPSYFGYTSMPLLDRYFLNMGQRIKYLNSKYGLSKMSKDEQKALFYNGFKKLYSGNIVQWGLATCEEDKLVCLATAAGEAIAMHLGCAALDTTVFVGIACHASAVIFQIVASRSCIKNYKNCKETIPEQ